VTDRSFARAWRTVAELRPDRVAIVCGDRRLTFGDFDARAARLACVLRDAGVGPDDKVSIMCVNGPEYLEAFFAAQKLGAVPVNVNYRYVGAELAYLLDNSDTAALVFTTTSHRPSPMRSRRCPPIGSPAYCCRSRTGETASCSPAHATMKRPSPPRPPTSRPTASPRATTSCSSTRGVRPAAPRP
jgi:non-ribosomal peptide synthetase component F